MNEPKEYDKLSEIIHVLMLQNNAKKEGELALMNSLLNQKYDSSINLLGELDSLVEKIAILHIKNSILQELHQSRRT